MIRITVALSFLAGCSAPAMSAETLIGKWQPLSKGADAMFLQLNPDGTCRQASSEDALANAPQSECTYTLEGSSISLTEVKVHGVPPCPSPTGKYQLQLAGNRMKLISAGDSCAPRRRSTAGEYQRVP